MNKESLEVYEMLKKNGIYAEVYSQDGLIYVSIEWGDWKHDHGYCDYLMAQAHYLSAGEDVTEEDGSDCYSSIHAYAFVG